MRLTPRHRHRNADHRRALRVEISQAEITADLLYPATDRPSPQGVGRRKPRR